MASEWTNIFEEGTPHEARDSWTMEADGGTCDVCEMEKDALLRLSVRGTVDGGHVEQTLDTETEICLACVVAEVAPAVGSRLLLELGHTLLQAAAGRIGGQDG